MTFNAMALASGREYSAWSESRRRIAAFPRRQNGGLPILSNPASRPLNKEIIMAKQQGQDSIEHVWLVIEQITRDMIAKAGSPEKVGAHRITDAVIRRIFSLGAASGEGDRLGRAFVKAAVQAVYTEAELRQRFKAYPQEKLSYESFWDTLSGP
jgi:hypothetical protein